jgi:hypothetical protein
MRTWYRAPRGWLLEPEMVLSGWGNVRFNGPMKYYKQHARRLSQEYNSLDPSSVHEAWVDLLAEQPGLACDIGAGSGREDRYTPTADFKSR